MNATEKEVFRVAMVNEIKMKKAVYGLTNEAIGKHLSLHPNTVAKYLDNPQKMSVADLSRLSDLMKLNPMTVVHFIVGDFK